MSPMLMRSFAPMTRLLDLDELLAAPKADVAAVSPAPVTLTVFRKSRRSRESFDIQYSSVKTNRTLFNAHCKRGRVYVFTLAGRLLRRCVWAVRWRANAEPEVYA